MIEKVNGIFFADENVKKLYNDIWDSLEEDLAKRNAFGNGVNDVVRMTYAKEITEDMIRKGVELGQVFFNVINHHSLL